MPNWALLGFRGIEAASRTLPESVLSGAARVITTAIPWIAPERRRIVERHLERSHGRALSAAEKQAGVRAVFGTYARYWTESTRLPTLTAEEIDRGFTYTGFEHIEDSVAAGKGTILVLPHLGGFEFAAAWLNKVCGYDVTAIVENLDDDEVREFMRQWRSGAGMQVVPLGKGLGAEIVKRLRANHIVCIMNDRDIAGGGVEVEFFGERTTIPGGAATLALRTGARIVPVAVYHHERTNHAVVRAPIAVERVGKRLADDVARITQNIAQVMEDQIRRAPTQWWVLQPNWPSDRVAP